MRHEKFPALFGKASNGKLKIWTLEVFERPDGTAYYDIQTGYTDGKHQSHITEVLSGKNIGKANETDCFEQAVSDARSERNKKIDSGYVEDIDNIPDEADVEMFLPMLAHKWEERGKNIVFPAYVQPKLDGMRMLARKQNGVVTAWSRKAKPVTVPDKIIAELGKMMVDGECVDGELYVHGWDFQRIISATKKKSPDTDLLEYWIYDSPRGGTFEQRFFTKTADYMSSPIPECIRLVDTKSVQTKEQIDKQLQLFIDQGFEGLIVRNTAGLYKFGHRSTDLLKYKMFEDAEYPIIGGRIIETGKDAGTIVFTCETPDGFVFDCRPRGTHEQRTEWANDLGSFVGKALTIRYQGLSNDGIPRFPVGVGVRDYE